MIKLWIYNYYIALLSTDCNYIMYFFILNIMYDILKELWIITSYYPVKQKLLVSFHKKLRLPQIFDNDFYMAIIKGNSFFSSLKIYEITEFRNSTTMSITCDVMVKKFPSLFYQKIAFKDWRDLTQIRK